MLDGVCLNKVVVLGRPWSLVFQEQRSSAEWFKRKIGAHGRVF